VLVLSCFRIAKKPKFLKIPESIERYDTEQGLHRIFKHSVEACKCSYLARVLLLTSKLIWEAQHLVVFTYDPVTALDK